MDGVMEGTAFITPMKLWNIGEGLNETQNAATVNTEASLFKDVFKNTIDQVKETSADVEHKQYLLATGQIEDPHTVGIAASQAQLSIDLLAALRTKALEAYNEIMRLSS